MKESIVFLRRIYSGERENGGMGERERGRKGEREKGRKSYLSDHPLTLSPSRPLTLFLLVALLFTLAACSRSEPVDEASHDHGQMAMEPQTRDDHTEVDPEAQGGERKILYWRAPMDRNEIYDRPGTSRMGMDLVPVYEDAAAASAPGTVSIDPVTLQNIGVRTAPVTVEALSRTIRTTGRFEMDERGAYTVSLKVGGWVEVLHVDYGGALVRQGEPLLELYSPELVSAQEEYLLALRNAGRLADGPAAQDARRLLEAARRRLLYWDLKDEQIDRLEATGESFRTLTFYAPASGEVMNKKVVAGQRIDAGQALMDIVDISKIWLIADVYEQDLGWVNMGASARIELPHQPGETWRGRVDHVYHMMNPETRSARVRIVLPGGHHSPLKPGMYATVYLEGEAAAPSPVVPEEALLRTGEQVLVLLSLGGGRFQPREIQIGFQTEGKVQVLAGLEEGEIVVTSAQFLIDSEARLQGAVGAMLGSRDATADETESGDADAH